MSNNRRVLRSTHSAIEPSHSTIAAPNPISSPLTFTTPSTPQPNTIKILPLGSKLPGLTTVELTLLRAKQARLTATATSTLASLPPGAHLLNALESTLIFAQYEAGTAVCIDKAGLILTCSHCFGDTEEEYEEGPKKKWMLFYTGMAVQVECINWDGRRDLALCEIIAIESPTGKKGEVPAFKSLKLGTDLLEVGTDILCIGQPGRDDLESTSARKTKYHLVEISEGLFRGMMKGVDVQDNRDIGTLMHDAWTYWGHSGAPLVELGEGRLVGLHSSWDDESAMRHGIPAVAIRGFLDEVLGER